IKSKYKKNGLTIETALLIQIHLALSRLRITVSIKFNSAFGSSSIYDCLLDFSSRNSSYNMVHTFGNSLDLTDCHELNGITQPANLLLIYNSLPLTLNSTSGNSCATVSKNWSMPFMSVLYLFK